MNLYPPGPFTSTLAGWDMGEVKLDEAAKAIPIISGYGEIPYPVDVFSAIGTIRTTSAVVGMMLVAIKLIESRPKRTP